MRTLCIAVLLLSGCPSVCVTRQTRCNDQLVEVCAGGKWRRFADCTRVLKLEDGGVVSGRCEVRNNGRAGCERK